MDEKSFYGGVLHVCYVPEYETVEDTRLKLQDRKRYVIRALQNKGMLCHPIPVYIKRTHKLKLAKDPFNNCVQATDALLFSSLLFLYSSGSGEEGDFKHTGHSISRACHHIRDHYYQAYQNLRQRKARDTKHRPLLWLSSAAVTSTRI